MMKLIFTDEKLDNLVTLLIAAVAQNALVSGEVDLTTPEAPPVAIDPKGWGAADES
jgi:hypothetical protein